VRMRIWRRYPLIQGFRSIYKWVKPVFLLGYYGCIVHGTWNSARLCQNFGILWGGGGWNPPNLPSVRHCPPKLCIHLSSPPYVLHAPPFSYISMLWPE
jgi:hypothetical protein